MGMTTDLFGREFKVGQTIVWPGRHGSYLYLSKGIIEEITPTTNWENRPRLKLKLRRLPGSKWEKDNKIVYVEQVHRAAIIGDLNG